MRGSFLFITGLIRALEKRRLGEEMVRSLIERPDAENVREVLRATYFRDWIPEGGDSIPVDLFLHRSREWAFLLARQFGGGELESIFRIHRDYHNMRTVLRGFIFNQNQSGLTSAEGLLPAGAVRTLLEEGRYGELPGFMGDAARESLEVYAATGSMLRMDCMLDSWLVRDILRRAGKTGSDMIRRHQRLAIDVANTCIFLRAGDLLEDKDTASVIFLEGGLLGLELFRTCRSRAELAAGLELSDIHAPLSRGVKEFDGNPFAPEREGDRVLLDALEESMYRIDGPDPLYAFLCRIDWETRVLGMILSAGLPGRQYVRMRLEGFS